jgi:hypothetical protein
VLLVLLARGPARVDSARSEPSGAAAEELGAPERAQAISAGERASIDARGRVLRRGEAPAVHLETEQRALAEAPERAAAEELVPARRAALEAVLTQLLSDLARDRELYAAQMGQGTADGAASQRALALSGARIFRVRRQLEGRLSLLEASALGGQAQARDEELIARARELLR